LLPIEVETGKKYSELNNALHFVELQDLSNGLWPSLLPIGINIAIVS